MLGLEADLQGAGAKGHAAYLNGSFAQPVPPGGVNAISRVDNDTSVDWLGTARARLGLFATPELLAYATGGLAYGETRSSTFVNQQWNSGGALGQQIQSSGSSGNTSKTMLGWTLGGGVEWMFSRNLSLKAEYLFYDLGSVNYGAGTLTTSIATVPDSVIANTRVHYDGQIARLGLNYHFDGPGAQ